MNDLNQEVRDGSTDLTATETSAVFEIGPTPPGGIGIEVSVPSAAGTSPTLDVTVEDAEVAAGTFAVIATMRQITDTTGRNADGVGTYYMRVPSHHSHARVVLTVGGSAGQSFGGVKVNFSNKGVRNNVQQGDLTTAQP